MKLSAAVLLLAPGAYAFVPLAPRMCAPPSGDHSHQFPRRELVHTAAAVAGGSAVFLSSYPSQAAVTAAPPQGQQQECANSAISFTKDTAKADEAAVLRTTDVWLRTVTSGKRSAPRDTAALYAPDAVLWGTLSEEVRDTPAEILDYFDYFARKPRLRVSGYKPLVRVLRGGDVAINSGYYTFSWDVTAGVTAGGGRAAKPARYTFVYRRDPRSPTGWVIVDHHSSVLPKAPQELRHANY